MTTSEAQKKIDADVLAFAEWARGHWCEYAAQSVGKPRKRLRLEVNCCGVVRVTLGDKVEYVGEFSVARAYYVSLGGRLVSTVPTPNVHDVHEYVRTSDGTCAVCGWRNGESCLDPEAFKLWLPDKGSINSKR